MKERVMLMSFGAVGDMFDLNFDGEIDALEQGAEYGFLNMCMNEATEENTDDYDF
jgi:hypothetical protein